MNNLVRFLLFLLIVLLVVAGVVAVIRGATRSSAAADPTPQVNLKTTASESELIIRGPVVGRENFHEVRLVINDNLRSLQINRGNQNSPITNKTYSNDAKAYKVFLGALTHNGVTDGASSSIDPNGYCYRGEVHLFSYQDASSDITKWSNTCDSSGDLNNERAIKKVFTAQFPDYKILTEDLDFRR